MNMKASGISMDPPTLGRANPREKAIPPDGALGRVSISTFDPADALTARAVLTTTINLSIKNHLVVEKEDKVAEKDQKGQAVAKGKSAPPGPARGKSPPGTMNKKTCEFHRKGGCPDGDSCDFWLQPDCTFYKKRTCTAGKNCRFRHAGGTAPPAADADAAARAKAKANAKSLHDGPPAGTLCLSFSPPRWVRKAAWKHEHRIDSAVD